MKNKDFDSFNNDRILAARKRVIDLLYLIGSWEEQRKSTKTTIDATFRIMKTIIL